MEIITNTVDFYLEKETAVAIGKFDGVHIGHRRLLEEIQECKKKGLASCVFTFEPAPAIFFGFSDGRLLTTKEEKRLLFERMGVDILVEFPLNKKTAAMSPAAFATEVLARQMNTRFLVAGTDLSFGAGGAGNAELLRKLGPELGFQVKTIEKVCMEGRKVSSTLVRTKVEEGEMQEAEQLLGMPYLVKGTVIKGNQIGRTIGFPTVNIQPEKDKLLPPNGVYFSQVRVGNRSYRAISNVGCMPTVSDTRVMGVESYLYQFEEDIYGAEIEVYLQKFRRPERKFDGIEALEAQLREDIAAGAVWDS